MYNIVDDRVRLSDSVIWDIQRFVYTSHGIRSWGCGYVPFYVTSTPLIADHYARVVMGFFTDCVFSGAVDRFNRTKPWYIIDLGAGSGRFSYLFIKKLLALLEASPLADLRICYVMADIAKKNIEAWKEHASLRPFIEKGVLDVALFDGADDGDAPVFLQVSGTALDRASLVNPLVAIGNYFFDAIVHDFFKAEGGALFEGRITMGYSTEDIDDIVSSRAARCATWEYSYDPVDGPYYPGFADLDLVLRRLAERYGTALIPFPLGGFRTMRRLKALSGGRLLFIVADQGLSTTEQALSCSSVVNTLETSFVMPIHFPAIEEYASVTDGAVVKGCPPHPALIIEAFLWGVAGASWKATRQAYDDTIGTFDSPSYWRLVDLVKGHAGTVPAELILLLVKMGQGDPVTLYHFLGDIKACVGSLSSHEKATFLSLVDKARDLFFPVSRTEGSFFCQVGAILLDLGEYDKAYGWLSAALDFGGDPSVHYAMAQCCARRGDNVASMEHIRRAQGTREEPRVDF